MGEGLLFNRNLESISVKKLIENFPDDSDNIYYHLGRMHVYEEVYKELYDEIPESMQKDMTCVSVMVYNWEKARRK